MSIGIVKFFNAGKGFGFVTPDGGGPDIFLPSASVTSSGLTGIKTGQRVSYEQAPDPKGPKIVSLKVIADVAPKSSAPAAERIMVFCDPTSPGATEVLEAVSACGYHPVLLDYVATPINVEQLRRLSYQVNETGQTLVRRFDPLFLALQLDDRFISIQDFWNAIAEHPTLINGPVLVRGGEARICKAASEVRAFLRGVTPNTVAKPKALSPRIVAMLRGETPPSVPHSPPERTLLPSLSETKRRGAKTKSTKPSANTPEKSGKKVRTPTERAAKKTAPAKKAAKSVKVGKPAKKKAKRK